MEFINLPIREVISQALRYLPTAVVTTEISVPHLTTTDNALKILYDALGAHSVPCLLESPHIPQSRQRLQNAQQIETSRQETPGLKIRNTTSASNIPMPMRSPTRPALKENLRF